MKKPLVATSKVVAAMMAVAECSTENDGGAKSDLKRGSSPLASQSSGTEADHNSADTTFTRMMIPHHVQAVEMGDIMLGKTGLDAKITALAANTTAAQNPEIVMMNAWLTGWSEPTAVVDHNSMNGMRTSEDLDKLPAAEGTEVSKLFLTQMSAHHEGVNEMVYKELASGENVDAVVLAKSIVAAQEK